MNSYLRFALIAVYLVDQWGRIASNHRKPCRMPQDVFIGTLWPKVWRSEFLGVSSPDESTELDQELRLSAFTWGSVYLNEVMRNQETATKTAQLDAASAMFFQNLGNRKGLGDAGSWA